MNAIIKQDIRLAQIAYLRNLNSRRGFTPKDPTAQQAIARADKTLRKKAKK